MKEYKVEALICYPEVTLDSERIMKKSKEEIQVKLDDYASQGYRLTSTSSTELGPLGAGVYIYLYFERDI